jgi:hypothetical protein
MAVSGRFGLRAARHQRGLWCGYREGALDPEDRATAMTAGRIRAAPDYRILDGWKHNLRPEYLVRRNAVLEDSVRPASN